MVMGRADRDWKVPVHRVTWLPRLATITIKSCATCLQPISMVTVHLTCKTHSPSFYRRKCQHNWVEQSRAGAKTHTLWNTEQQHRAEMKQVHVTVRPFLQHQLWLVSPKRFVFGGGLWITLQNTIFLRLSSVHWFLSMTTCLQAQKNNI